MPMPMMVVTSPCTPAAELTGPPTLTAPDTSPARNSAGSAHQPPATAAYADPTSSPAAPASAGSPTCTMPVLRVPGRSLIPASIAPSPASTPAAGFPSAIPAPSNGPAASAPRTTAPHGTGARCQRRGWASQAGRERRGKGASSGRCDGERCDVRRCDVGR
jgi:hypothetical protein